MKSFIIVLVAILAISLVGCEKEIIAPPLITDTLITDTLVTDTLVTDTLVTDTLVTDTLVTGASAILNDMLNHVFISREEATPGHFFQLNAYIWVFNDTAFGYLPVDTNNMPVNPEINLHKIFTSEASNWNDPSTWHWNHTEKPYVYAQQPGMASIFEIRIEHNIYYQDETFAHMSNGWPYRSPYMIRSFRSNGSQVDGNEYGHLEIYEDTTFTYIPSND